LFSVLSTTDEKATACVLYQQRQATSSVKRTRDAQKPKTKEELTMAMETEASESSIQLENEESRKVAEAALQELKTAALSSTSKKSKKKICQECRDTNFRYQCPRCSFRTCSLKCCKSHKERTGCNGKRDRTKFLPIAHMTDGTIDSDYHFLEDVLGAVERAKRAVGGASGNIQHNKQGNKRQKKNHEVDNSEEHEHTGAAHPMLQQIENFKKQEQSQQDTTTPSSVSRPRIEEPKSFKVDGEKDTDSKAEGSTHSIRPVGTLPQNCWKQLGPKWRHFWQQTSIRGVNLLLMPVGMQRRKDNSSHIKKDIIYWKTEVRVHDPNEQPTVHFLKLSEQALLLEELQKLSMSAGSEHAEMTAKALSGSTVERKMHWLIQKLPSPSNRPCYSELTDSQATLQSTLKGMTLIEYPTIEAVPDEMLCNFPRAIEEVPNSGESTKEASAS
jgi:hypothetical protein